MRRLRWHDFITLNLFWLGLSTTSNAMTPIILPVLVQRFVPEAVKNTFYGDIRFYGLMVALLIQPMMGMLSDRSASRWGRRRPFILVGAVFTALLVLAIGGATSYWALFAITLLMQVSSNIAHGALQGLIPDLAPEDQRGRVSGVKAIMELAPIVIVAFTVGKMVGAGQMWPALLFVAGMVLLTMLITLLTVRETPLAQSPKTPLWEPLGRIALLTLAFMLIVQGFRALTIWVGGQISGSVTLLLLTVGVMGLAAVLLSIVVGVWVSVWLGVGREIKRYTSYSWWVVNRLLFLAAVGSLQGFALYFLQDVLRVPNAPSATGTLMMVVGLCTLLSALPSGFLADRFGRKTLLVIAGLAATAGTILLILAPSLTVVYISGCLIGLATGAFMTTNWALGTALVPAEECGRFLGISNLAGAGAGAVGAGIGGPLADYFNAQQPGLGYLVLFAILAICFLLSVVSLRGVREGQRAATA
jgi:MFS family permease